MKYLLRLLTLTLFLSSFSTAQTPPEKSLLMRNPAISKTSIAFVYAGDLWTVGRDGGEAKRLTSGVGIETDPYFSPDGSMIAFTGEYDGNVDIYVVPASGGEPKRISYHPGADRVVGWTPDGKQILFVSARNTYSRFSRLNTIAIDGVFPTEIPLPMAYEGSYSADGTKMAYVPLPHAFDAWKRYRGGRTTPIWIANLSDSATEKIPRENSNDYAPMWIGNKIYFLSDRNGAITLFSYETITKKVNQEIANAGLDIKSASATTDAIAYEQFGSINIFDLKAAKSKKLNITINSDLTTVRPRFEKAANRIQSSALSPTGARAIFEARGEIISVPAEKGNPRNLTNSSSAAERNPSWSPNGKWIAYFSDESGEYALHLRDQTGMGEVKKITLPPNFYYAPNWSPDSKKISFYDKALNLWYLDIEKTLPVKVDTTHADRNSFNPSWSPDNRWITYTKMLKSWTRAVFAYSVEENKSTQITDGMSDARFATFDKNGKYLYFTASTDFGPTQAGLDMSSYPVRSTRNVYVVVLKKTDPSPLAPESDEEKVVEEKPEDKKNPEVTAAAAFKSAAPKPPIKVEIDFENIGQRILALPIPARNFIGLDAGKAGNIYLAELPVNAVTPGVSIHKFDLEKRKFDKVLDGAASFDISANSEKMLYQQGENWFIVPTATPVKPGDGKIKTEDMEIHLDPIAEWNQMYREVWRLERDFFYDPNHHGLNLKAAEKKYEPYLKSLSHRADLNYLFQEMLGELTVGHLYVNGGDVPDPKRIAGGLLGCDYKIENGRYRFARVYNGENWNPNLRAPLTQPGINVNVGEYLLAVNGRNLTATDNVYKAFEATAGKNVVIRVGANPDGSGSREVTVVPVPTETALRNLAWIEDNRRKVDQMSGGKLAYVYLPDTAQGGFTNFNRYYFAQLDKEGAVIDERFNGGGSAADYIIDFLRKPVMSYWARREGGEETTPFGVIQGPKVMIVNEFAGSGGDMLPWMFRRNKIGQLVGKRTWGGLVGIGGYPVLADGGTVTAPHFGFYSPEGQWEVENYGVAPDIEIDMEPVAWRAGKDVQLEKAVEVALTALQKNPIKKTPRPAYPNYQKPPTPEPTKAAKK